MFDLYTRWTRCTSIVSVLASIRSCCVIGLAMAPFARWNAVEVRETALRADVPPPRGGVTQIYARSPREVAKSKGRISKVH